MYILYFVFQTGGFQSFLSLQAGSDSRTECCRRQKGEERHCRHKQGNDLFLDWIYHQMVTEVTVYIELVIITDGLPRLCCFG